jgi:hypothetical protein
MSMLGGIRTVRLELDRQASRTLIDRRDRLMNSGNGGD